MQSKSGPARGSKESLDELMPLVYRQLRKLAARSLRSERPNHTLRATALVHEAYLRLASAGVAWTDEVHFYAMAACAMRRILVDHARRRGRQKRAGGTEHIALDQAVEIRGETTSAGLLDLDGALRRLSALDTRKARIIELLFFGGLTHNEAAAVLEISPATLHRELAMAKAWLCRELTRSGREPCA
jgi:RNA polymerase sigma factor (TIGR02999 family)